ncbi:response regulator transcription factor [Nocardia rhizosphaerihabitans]|uniref:response regulator transcription factor n=1 Tax=Nocardia rhizosphaerihabitans TaxID=1691570 RepID=UPI001665BF80|nr:response regulator transcription factor [Nocardia rhizosphaerihabitans]
MFQNEAIAGQDRSSVGDGLWFIAEPSWVRVAGESRRLGQYAVRASRIHGSSIRGGVVRPTEPTQAVAERASIGSECRGIPIRTPDLATRYLVIPNTALSEERVSIEVVADNSLTREMLCGFLGSEDDFVVISGVSWNEADRRTGAVAPDVIVLDIDEIGSGAVRITRSLIRKFPDAAIVVLNSGGPGHVLYDMLEIGVRCFLHKGISRSELVTSIRGVASVENQITVSVPREFLTCGGPSSRGRLSAREEQVVRLVGEAMTNRQIANALSITEGTVKRHLRSIFDKLGAVSRIDAVNRYRTLEGRQDSA